MKPVPPACAPAAALAAVLVCALAGCATGDCIAPVGNPGLTPDRVSATGGHSGELQRWGGVLAQARNLERSTELEVIAYPLDRCGVPRTGAPPVGRFVLIRPGYLETADLPPGSRISATGILVGTREGLVGDAPYRFPLLSSERIRRWSDGPDYGEPVPVRPWVSIGIGGWSGNLGGGIGVHF
jgi:outer membrane lipoprotein